VAARDLPWGPLSDAPLSLPADVGGAPPPPPPRGGDVDVTPTPMRLRHIHKVVPTLCVSGWRSIQPSFSIWRRQRCTCLVEIPDLRARFATEGHAWPLSALA
jgi:hypothetical protein